MRKKFKHFIGQMPICFTPRNTIGDIDIDSTKRLVELLMQSHPAAVGHLAGASEYHKISQKDRDICITTTVEQVSGRVPVFIGNTDISLKQALENAKRAVELGADMIMTCSPHLCACNSDQLYDYYKAVCDTVDVPIIVQDTGASSRCYTPEFIAKLSGLPNISYAKCEGPNFLTYTKRLMDMAGDKLQVIGGASGHNMLALLHLGVTAFMTGTEAPEMHSAVIKAYVEGKHELAEEIFVNCICPYLDLYGIASRTTALHHLHRRGIVTTPTLQWPNEEGALDPTLEKEFDWMMQRCMKRFEQYC